MHFKKKIEDAENAMGSMPSKRQKTAFAESSDTVISSSGNASRAFGNSISTAVYNL